MARKPFSDVAANINRGAATSLSRNTRSAPDGDAGVRREPRIPPRPGLPQHLIDLTNYKKPDLVLITGDLVDTIRFGSANEFALLRLTPAAVPSEQ